MRRRREGRREIVLPFVVLFAWVPMRSLDFSLASSFPRLMPLVLPDLPTLSVSEAESSDNSMSLGKLLKMEEIRFCNVECAAPGDTGGGSSRRGRGDVAPSLESSRGSATTVTSSRLTTEAGCAEGAMVERRRLRASEVTRAGNGFAGTGTVVWTDGVDVWIEGARVWESGALVVAGGAVMGGAGFGAGCTLWVKDAAGSAWASDADWGSGGRAGVFFAGGAPGGTRSGAKLGAIVSGTRGGA